MSAPIQPLLDPEAMTALQRVLEEFTVEAVHEQLGPVGQAAQERGDIDGALRELTEERTATLIRLLLLGVPVSDDAARAAFGPLAGAAPLFDTDGDQIRARVEVRPYGDDSGAQWWVVSDFGSDVRPGPLAADHVLGIGGASLTLAQATIRRPVNRALDIGTGCGVQALHLFQHAGHVVATDLSDRALRLAATTAALSGQTWDLRQGSLLDPVSDEQFDLVVANPPFVVSPGLAAGRGGFDYRDSGLSGDDVSRDLIRGVPRRLAPGGTASMLANWIIPADGDWTERISGWLSGAGCDAWVWQREVLGVGEYVSLWLRDAGETPGTPRWSERYERWVQWFSDFGIPAVGMGLVTLWRTDADDPMIVCEDVVQPVEQPCGAHLPTWHARQRWLAHASDAEILATRLHAAPDLVRTRYDVHGRDGWEEARTELRLSHGMRWELEADAGIAALVGACSGEVPLGFAIEVLAASMSSDVDEVREAALPVIRDLIGRGFLAPEADLA